MEVSLKFAGPNFGVITAKLLRLMAANAAAATSKRIRFIMISLSDNVG